MIGESLLKLLNYGLILLICIYLTWIAILIRQDTKAVKKLLLLHTSSKASIIHKSTSVTHSVTPTTTLGRSSSSTIAIDDTAVSMNHAKITRKNAIWWLVDLNSKNGTMLNNQLISQPTVISNGDSITIGRHIFIFKE